MWNEEEKEWNNDKEREIYGTPIVIEYRYLVVLLNEIVWVKA